MLAFLLRPFIILTIFHSNILLAMESYYDEDVTSSEKSFIISGSFSESSSLDTDKKNQGVMTLCFKPQPPSKYEHAALVFEYFEENILKKDNPYEVNLCVIHYSGTGNCHGGGGKMSVKIENREYTLKKVYRKRTVYKTNISPKEIHGSAEFSRYASWVIDKENLKKGYNKAEAECGKGGIYFNCITFVRDIMETVGIKGVNFGLRGRIPKNLKQIVDQSIKDQSIEIKHIITKYDPIVSPKNPNNNDDKIL